MLYAHVKSQKSRFLQSTVPGSPDMHAISRDCGHSIRVCLGWAWKWGPLVSTVMERWGWGAGSCREGLITVCGFGRDAVVQWKFHYCCEIWGTWKWCNVAHSTLWSTTLLNSTGWFVVSCGYSIEERDSRGLWDLYSALESVVHVTNGVDAGYCWAACSKRTQSY